MGKEKLPGVGKAGKVGKKWEKWLVEALISLKPGQATWSDRCDPQRTPSPH